MKPGALFVILSLFGMSCAAAQEFEPGFYLSQQIKSKKCPNKIQIGKAKSEFLCLTDKPIIGGKEFVSVSSIRTDETTDIVFVDLALSSEAIQTIKAISTTMNESELALIIESEVVGLFDYEGLNQMTGNFIRVSDSENSGRMTDIYVELSRIIQENKSLRR